MTDKPKKQTLTPKIRLQQLQSDLSQVEASISQLENQRVTPEQEAAALIAGQTVKPVDSEALSALKHRRSVLTEAVRMQQQAAAVQHRTEQKQLRRQKLVKHRQLAQEAHQHLKDFVKTAMKDAAYCRECSALGTPIADLQFPLSLSPVNHFNPEMMLKLWEEKHAALLQ